MTSLFKATIRALLASALPAFASSFSKKKELFHHNRVKQPLRVNGRNSRNSPPGASIPSVNADPIAGTVSRNANSASRAASRANSSPNSVPLLTGPDRLLLLFALFVFCKIASFCFSHTILFLVLDTRTHAQGTSGTADSLWIPNCLKSDDGSLTSLANTLAASSSGGFITHGLQFDVPSPTALKKAPLG